MARLLSTYEGIDDIRLSIIKTITVPINNLTVREICAKAKISKQTFYSRFSSKYEISQWYAMHYENRYLNEIGRTLSWEDGLEPLFGAYELHGALFYNTSARVKDLEEQEEITKSRRRKIIITTLKDYRHVEITEAMMFVIEAFLETEVFLVGEWFRGNLTPSSQVFAAYYRECIPQKLYRAMQIPELKKPAKETESKLFLRHYDNPE